MATANGDINRPCHLTIDIPFPTSRLATIAMRALSPDKELSNLVSRTFSTVRAPEASSDEHTVLRTEYSATTNRMLRVAVNSFMDSVQMMVEVMENLDADVLELKEGS